jgi:FAD/FMN-containing dehydrogenase
MAPTLAVQDAVVPRTRLAEILDGIARIAAEHRVVVCNVFHAGDGNLHPNIPYDGDDPDEAARVHHAMQQIMALCIDAGGTITGEHGVGFDKLPYMDALFTDETLAAMCRLRPAFDPDRRANPGKVVPVRSCREWYSARSIARHDTPRAVTYTPHVSVLTPEEARIADMVRAARTAGEPVCVAGAGTHASAVSGANVIDVRDACDVIAYVPADLTITAGAGLTVRDLDEITREHGQWCPLLPWGTDDATLGGVLAAAGGGPATGALGAPRDIALGLSFVDGTGAMVRAGGRVVKNVAGFDLTRTLIGSWGSLGVITSVSLRLRALPRAQETWLVPRDAARREQFRRMLQGAFAPVATHEITADIAAEFGAARAEHIAVWIAGNDAHVAAARDALCAAGAIHQASQDIWRVVRRSYPPARWPAAQTTAREEINARVRGMFDPSGIFVCSAMPRGDMTALELRAS